MRWCRKDADSRRQREKERSEMGVKRQSRDEAGKQEGEKAPFKKRSFVW